MVALAGMNLSLVHYVSLNELGALLGSNELTALLSLSAYFLGLSGGYLISDKLRRGHLLAVGAATLALHATLPFSVRMVTAYLWRWHEERWIPPFFFALVLFGITPFYGVFLPRLVDAPETMGARFAGGERRLVPLYATELAGSAAGLLVAVVLTPARMGIILALHLMGLFGLLILCAGERRLLYARLLVPVGVGYAVLFSALDRVTLERYYEERRGFAEVRMLASEFSPYQRVDIFEGTWHSGKKERHLFLDGNQLYGSTSLHQHNLFVSILPNLVLKRPTNALVVAGGSLDAARYLAPRVRHLRVVEIDEAVTRLAREHLQAPRGGFPEGWDLIIDDGKHFLGTWEGPGFDVISVDVPMPTHLQTATLHAERFFALARRRLAPGGIFSISLSGNFSPPDKNDPYAVPLEQRVAAGLVASFPHVIVVQTPDASFAWCTEAPLAVTDEAIREAIVAFERESGTEGEFGRPPVRILDEVATKARAAGYAPIGEADMQIVLQLSIRKLHEKYYESHH